MPESSPARPGARERVLQRELLRGEDAFAPEVTPLPWLGRVGFAVAVGTLAAVVIGLVRSAPPSSSVVFPLWCVLYASGLAASWWLMRPRATVKGSYGLGAGVLLGQGLVYLAFWLPLAVFGSAEVSLGFLTDVQLLGAWRIVAVLAMIGALIVGPVFGCLVPFATRRGGWMCLTQWFGFLAPWALGA